MVAPPVAPPPPPPLPMGSFNSGAVPAFQPTLQEFWDKMNNPMNKNREADSLVLAKLPQIAGYKNWKLVMKKKVASASGKPDLCFAWLIAFETAATWEELENSGDLWTSLDAKWAAALSESTHGPLATKIRNIEEKLATQGKMLKGRQMAWIIDNYFRINELDSALVEFDDLLAGL